MLRPLSLLAFLVLLACLHPTTAYLHPFQDPDVSTDDRISNLLSLLNLTEKLSLLYNTAPPIPRLAIDRFDFGQECLHGLVNRRSDLSRDGRATAFPQSIGLAASWNVSLMASMGRVISDEARGKRNGRIRAGNSTRSDELTYLMCWTPVVNILKDPRWGRSAETYGESPLLTYKLTSAVLSGLYGSNDRYVKIAPVLKHYTVYDGPEEGRFSFNAQVTAADMHDTFTYVYRSLIQEQPNHVRGLMASYSALNGVPVAADFDLLTKQPVFDWGWRDGHIVSDCDAVGGIWKDHHYVADEKSAAALSLLAGMDIDCGTAFDSLIDAIDDGIIGEPDIDAALEATMNIQMMVGFYDPFGLSPFDNISEAVVDSPAHRQAALDAAHQSILLLQNDGTLPLDSTKLRRIAVIGPTANDTAEYEACTLGSGGSCLLLHIYHAYTDYLVQPLQGVEAYVAGSGVEVVYARGCERYGSDQSGFKQAMAMANGSDVIVFVGGLDYSVEEEDTDRGDLQLPTVQQQLLTQLATLNTPIVTVLLHGGALSDDVVGNVSSAVLSCGYPGQATGLAIADILFGAVSPSAKLPYTVYTDTTQLPAIGDYHMTDAPGRTYRFFNDTPRHYFGDGLSYTTFQYTNLTTAVDASSQYILVAVSLSNVGGMDGSEVVQLYAAYDANFSGVTEAAVVELSVPRRQLLAFDKQHVRRGESGLVQFNVSVAQLTAFGRWAVQPAAAQPSEQPPPSPLHITRPLMEEEVRVLASGFRAERQRLEARQGAPPEQPITNVESVTLPVWLSVGGCQPTIDRMAAGVVLVQQVRVTAPPQLVPQGEARTNDRLLQDMPLQTSVME